MGRFTLCLAAIALLAVTVFAEEEHVVTLTGENFSEVVKANSKLVVEFYAPWCGHCKNLTPEYEKAAKELKAEGIVLAKMDATEEGNKATAAKFGIKGFPTLKMFRGDESVPIEYDGPREAAGIVSYTKKQFGPPSQELTDAAAVIKATTSPAEATVLGVFPGGEKSAEYEAFVALANALRADSTFVHTFDASITADCADCKAATLFVYKDFDQPMLKFDGAFEKDAMTKFVETSSSPTFVTLDQSSKNKKALAKIFADKKPKALFFVAPDHEDIAAFKAKFSELTASQDKVHILYVEPASNPGAVEFFGLKSEDLPAIAIHDAATNSKYSLTSLALSKIDSYLEDYNSGKLQKTIKSADIPETNDEPVKVVVSKQFEEIVFSGNDVLIEFYAPWCGHCKTLAPLYNELAAKLKEHKHITIAKMDATANDVPDNRFDVKGFPTLYFVSGKDGKVIPFAGERTVEGMETFVMAQSTAGAADNESTDDADDDADDEEEAQADAKDEL